MDINLGKNFNCDVSKLLNRVEMSNRSILGEKGDFQRSKLRLLGSMSTIVEENVNSQVRDLNKNVQELLDTVAQNDDGDVACKKLHPVSISSTATRTSLTHSNMSSITNSSDPSATSFDVDSITFCSSRKSRSLNFSKLSCNDNHDLETLKSRVNLNSKSYKTENSSTKKSFSNNAIYNQQFTVYPVHIEIPNFALRKPKKSASSSSSISKRNLETIKRHYRPDICRSLIKPVSFRDINQSGDQDDRNDRHGHHNKHKDRRKHRTDKYIHGKTSPEKQKVHHRRDERRRSKESKSRHRKGGNSSKVSIGSSIDSNDYYRERNKMVCKHGKNEHKQSFERKASPEKSKHKSTSPPRDRKKTKLRGDEKGDVTEPSKHHHSPKDMSKEHRHKCHGDSILKMAKQKYLLMQGPPEENDDYKHQREVSKSMKMLKNDNDAGVRDKTKRESSLVRIKHSLLQLAGFGRLVERNSLKSKNDKSSRKSESPPPNELIPVYRHKNKTKHDPTQLTVKVKKSCHMQRFLAQDDAVLEKLCSCEPLALTKKPKSTITRSELGSLEIPSFKQMHKKHESRQRHRKSQKPKEVIATHVDTGTMPHTDAPLLLHRDTLQVIKNEVGTESPSINTNIRYAVGMVGDFDTVNPKSSNHSHRQGVTFLSSYDSHETVQAWDTSLSSSGKISNLMILSELGTEERSNAVSNCKNASKREPNFVEQPNSNSRRIADHHGDTLYCCDSTFLSDPYCYATLNTTLNKRKNKNKETNTESVCLKRNFNAQICPNVIHKAKTFLPQVAKIKRNIFKRRSSKVVNVNKSKSLNEPLEQSKNIDVSCAVNGDVPDSKSKIPVFSNEKCLLLLNKNVDVIWPKASALTNNGKKAMNAKSRIPRLKPMDNKLKKADASLKTNISRPSNEITTIVNQEEVLSNSIQDLFEISIISELTKSNDLLNLDEELLDFDSVDDTKQFTMKDNESWLCKSYAKEGYDENTHLHFTNHAFPKESTSMTMWSKTKNSQKSLLCDTKNCIDQISERDEYKSSNAKRVATKHNEESKTFGDNTSSGLTMHQNEVPQKDFSGSAMKIDDHPFLTLQSCIRRNDSNGTAQRGVLHVPSLEERSSNTTFIVSLAEFEESQKNAVTCTSRTLLEDSFKAIASKMNLREAFTQNASCSKTSVSLQVLVPTKHVNTNTSWPSLQKFASQKRPPLKSRLPLPINSVRSKPVRNTYTFPIEIDLNCINQMEQTSENVSQQSIHQRNQSSETSRPSEASNYLSSLKQNLNFINSNEEFSNDDDDAAPASNHCMRCGHWWGRLLRKILCKIACFFKCRSMLLDKDLISLDVILSMSNYVEIFKLKSLDFVPMLEWNLTATCPVPLSRNMKEDATIPILRSLSEGSLTFIGHDWLHMLNVHRATVQTNRFDDGAETETQSQEKLINVIDYDQGSLETLTPIVENVHNAQPTAELTSKAYSEPKPTIIQEGSTQVKLETQLPADLHAKPNENPDITPNINTKVAEPVTKPTLNLPAASVAAPVIKPTTLIKKKASKTVSYKTKRQRNFKLNCYRRKKQKSDLSNIKESDLIFDVQPESLGKLANTHVTKTLIESAKPEIVLDANHNLKEDIVKRLVEHEERALQREKGHIIEEAKRRNDQQIKTLNKQAERVRGRYPNIYTPITRCDLGMTYYNFKSALRYYIREKNTLRMLTQCTKGHMQKAPKTEPQPDQEPVLGQLVSYDCKKNLKTLVGQYIFPDMDAQAESATELLAQTNRRNLVDLEVQNRFLHEIHPDFGVTGYEVMPQTDPIEKPMKISCKASCICTEICICNDETGDDYTIKLIFKPNHQEICIIFNQLEFKLILCDCLSCVDCCDCVGGLDPEVRHQRLFETVFEALKRNGEFLRKIRNVLVYSMHELLGIGKYKEIAREFIRELLLAIIKYDGVCFLDIVKIKKLEEKYRSLCIDSSDLEPLKKWVKFAECECSESDSFPDSCSGSSLRSRLSSNLSSSSSSSTSSSSASYTDLKEKSEQISEAKCIEIRKKLCLEESSFTNLLSIHCCNSCSRLERVSRTTSLKSLKSSKSCGCLFDNESTVSTAIKDKLKKVLKGKPRKSKFTKIETQFSIGIGDNYILSKVESSFFRPVILQQIVHYKKEINKKDSKPKHPSLELERFYNNSDYFIPAPVVRHFYTCNEVLIRHPPILWVLAKRILHRPTRRICHGKVSKDRRKHRKKRSQSPPCGNREEENMSEGCSPCSRKRKKRSKTRPHKSKSRKVGTCQNDSDCSCSSASMEQHFNQSKPDQRHRKVHKRRNDLESHGSDDTDPCAEAEKTNDTCDNSTRKKKKRRKKKKASCCAKSKCHKKPASNPEIDSDNRSAVQFRMECPRCQRDGFLPCHRRSYTLGNEAASSKSQKATSTSRCYSDPLLSERKQYSNKTTSPSYTDCSTKPNSRDNPSEFKECCCGSSCHKLDACSETPAKRKWFGLKRYSSKKSQPRSDMMVIACKNEELPTETNNASPVSLCFKKDKQTKQKQRKSKTKAPDCSACSYDYKKSTALHDSQDSTKPSNQSQHLQRDSPEVGYMRQIEHQPSTSSKTPSGASNKNRNGPKECVNTKCSKNSSHNSTKSAPQAKKNADKAPSRGDQIKSQISCKDCTNIKQHQELEQAKGSSLALSPYSDSNNKDIKASENFPFENNIHTQSPPSLESAHSMTNNQKELMISMTVITDETFVKNQGLNTNNVTNHEIQTSVTCKPNDPKRSSWLRKTLKTFCKATSKPLISNPCFASLEELLPGVTQTSFTHLPFTHALFGQIKRKSKENKQGVSLECECIRPGDPSSKSKIRPPRPSSPVTISPSHSELNQRIADSMIMFDRPISYQEPGINAFHDDDDDYDDDDDDNDIAQHYKNDTPVRFQEQPINQFKKNSSKKSTKSTGKHTSAVPLLATEDAGTTYSGEIVKLIAHPMKKREVGNLVKRGQATKAIDAELIYPEPSHRVNREDCCKPKTTAKQKSTSKKPTTICGPLRFCKSQETDKYQDVQTMTVEKLRDPKKTVILPGGDLENPCVYAHYVQTDFDICPQTTTGSTMPYYVSEPSINSKTFSLRSSVPTVHMLNPPESSDENNLIQTTSGSKPIFKETSTRIIDDPVIGLHSESKYTEVTQGLVSRLVSSHIKETINDPEGYSNVEHQEHFHIDKKGSVNHKSIVKEAGTDPETGTKISRSIKSEIHGNKVVEKSKEKAIDEDTDTKITRITKTLTDGVVIEYNEHAKQTGITDRDAATIDKTTYILNDPETRIEHIEEIVADPQSHTKTKKVTDLIEENDKIAQEQYLKQSHHSNKSNIPSKIVTLLEGVLHHEKSVGSDESYLITVHNKGVLDLRTGEGVEEIKQTEKRPGTGSVVTKVTTTSIGPAYSVSRVVIDDTRTDQISNTKSKTTTEIVTDNLTGLSTETKKHNGSVHVRVLERGTSPSSHTRADKSTTHSVLTNSLSKNDNSKKSNLKHETHDDKTQQAGTIRQDNRSIQFPTASKTSNVKSQRHNATQIGKPTKNSVISSESKPFIPYSVSQVVDDSSDTDKTNSFTKRKFQGTGSDTSSKKRRVGRISLTEEEMACCVYKDPAKYKESITTIDKKKEHHPESKTKCCRLKRAEKRKFTKSIEKKDSIKQTKRECCQMPTYPSKSNKKSKSTKEVPFQQKSSNISITSKTKPSTHSVDSGKKSSTRSVTSEKTSSSYATLKDEKSPSQATINQAANIQKDCCRLPKPVRETHPSKTSVSKTKYRYSCCKFMKRKQKAKSEPHGAAEKDYSHDVPDPKSLCCRIDGFNINKKSSSAIKKKSKSDVVPSKQSVVQPAQAGHKKKSTSHISIEKSGHVSAGSHTTQKSNLVEKSSTGIHKKHSSDHHHVLIQVGEECCQPKLSKKQTKQEQEQKDLLIFGDCCNDEIKKQFFKLGMKKFKKIYPECCWPIIQKEQKEQKEEKEQKDQTITLGKKEFNTPSNSNSKIKVCCPSMKKKTEAIGQDWLFNDCCEDIIKEEFKNQTEKKFKRTHPECCWPKLEIRVIASAPLPQRSRSHESEKEIQSSKPLSTSSSKSVKIVKSSKDTSKAESGSKVQKTGSAKKIKSTESTKQAETESVKSIKPVIKHSVSSLKTNETEYSNEVQKKEEIRVLKASESPVTKKGCSSKCLKKKAIEPEPNYEFNKCCDSEVINDYHKLGPKKFAKKYPECCWPRLLPKSESHHTKLIVSQPNMIHSPESYHSTTQTMAASKAQEPDDNKKPAKKYSKKSSTNFEYVFNDCCNDAVREEYARTGPKKFAKKYPPCCIPKKEAKIGPEEPLTATKSATAAEKERNDEIKSVANKTYCAKCKKRKDVDKKLLVKVDDIDMVDPRYKYVFNQCCNKKTQENFFRLGEEQFMKIYPECCWPQKERNCCDDDVEYWTQLLQFSKKHPSILEKLPDCCLEYIKSLRTLEENVKINIEPEEGIISKLPSHHPEPLAHRISGVPIIVQKVPSNKPIIAVIPPRNVLSTPSTPIIVTHKLVAPPRASAIHMATPQPPVPTKMASLLTPAEEIMPAMPSFIPTPPTPPPLPVITQSPQASNQPVVITLSPPTPTQSISSPPPPQKSLTPTPPPPPPPPLPLPLPSISVAPPSLPPSPTPSPPSPIAPPPTPTIPTQTITPPPAPPPPVVVIQQPLPSAPPPAPSLPPIVPEPQSSPSLPPLPSSPPPPLLLPPTTSSKISTPPPQPAPPPQFIAVVPPRPPPIPAPPLKVQPPPQYKSPVPIQPSPRPAPPTPKESFVPPPVILSHPSPAPSTPKVHHHPPVTIKVSPLLIPQENQEPQSLPPLPLPVYKTPPLRPQSPAPSIKSTPQEPAKPHHIHKVPLPTPSPGPSMAKEPSSITIEKFPSPIVSPPASISSGKTKVDSPTISLQIPPQLDPNKPCVCKRKQTPSGKIVPMKSAYCLCRPEDKIDPVKLKCYCKKTKMNLIKQLIWKDNKNTCKCKKSAPKHQNTSSVPYDHINLARMDGNTRTKQNWDLDSRNSLLDQIDKYLGPSETSSAPSFAYKKKSSSALKPGKNWKQFMPSPKESKKYMKAMIPAIPRPIGNKPKTILKKEPNMKRFAGEKKSVTLGHVFRQEQVMTINSRIEIREDENIKSVDYEDNYIGSRKSSRGNTSVTPEDEKNIKYLEQMNMDTYNDQKFVQRSSSDSELLRQESSSQDIFPPYLIVKSNNRESDVVFPEPVERVESENKLSNVPQECTTFKREMSPARLPSVPLSSISPTSSSTISPPLPPTRKKHGFVRWVKSKWFELDQSAVRAKMGTKLAFHAPNIFKDQTNKSSQDMQEGHIQETDLKRAFQCGCSTASERKCKCGGHITPYCHCKQGSTQEHIVNYNFIDYSNIYAQIDTPWHVDLNLTSYTCVFEINHVLQEDEVDDCIDKSSSRNINEGISHEIVLDDILLEKLGVGDSDWQLDFTPEELLQFDQIPSFSSKNRLSTIVERTEQEHDQECRHKSTEQEPKQESKSSQSDCDSTICKDLEEIINIYNRLEAESSIANLPLCGTVEDGVPRVLIATEFNSLHNEQVYNCRCSNRPQISNSECSDLHLYEKNSKLGRIFNTFNKKVKHSLGKLKKNKRSNEYPDRVSPADDTPPPAKSLKREILRFTHVPIASANKKSNMSELQKDEIRIGGTSYLIRPAKYAKGENLNSQRTINSDIPSLKSCDTTQATCRNLDVINSSCNVNSRVDILKGMLNGNNREELVKIQRDITWINQQIAGKCRESALKILIDASEQVKQQLQNAIFPRVQCSSTATLTKPELCEKAVETAPTGQKSSRNCPSVRKALTLSTENCNCVSIQSKLGKQLSEERTHDELLEFRASIRRERDRIMQEESMRKKEAFSEALRQSSCFTVKDAISVISSEDLCGLYAGHRYSYVMKDAPAKDISSTISCQSKRLTHLLAQNLSSQSQDVLSTITESANILSSYAPDSSPVYPIMLSSSKLITDSYTQNDGSIDDGESMYYAENTLSNISNISYNQESLQFQKFHDLQEERWNALRNIRERKSSHQQQQVNILHSKKHKAPHEVQRSSAVNKILVPCDFIAGQPEMMLVEAGPSSRSEKNNDMYASSISQSQCREVTSLSSTPSTESHENVRFRLKFQSGNREHPNVQNRSYILEKLSKTLYPKSEKEYVLNVHDYTDEKTSSSKTPNSQRKVIMCTGKNFSKRLSDINKPRLLVSPKNPTNKNDRKQVECSPPRVYHKYCSGCFDVESYSGYDLHIPHIDKEECEDEVNRTAHNLDKQTARSCYNNNSKQYKKRDQR